MEKKLTTMHAKDLEKTSAAARVGGVLVKTGVYAFLIVMALICNGFRDLQLPDMTWAAVKCLGWEIGLTVASCIAVDVLVVLAFDRQGYRREKVTKE